MGYDPTQVAVLDVPRIEDVDFGRLRSERLGRLQAKMKQYELPACLFYGHQNIRYATGTEWWQIFSLQRFERYCIVPADGEPVLFEFVGLVDRSRELVADVREAMTWQYTGSGAGEVARAWAKEIRATLEELGLGGEPLGVDRLDTPGFLALQEAGIRIVDSGPATVDAREIKTAEEIKLFKINGAIGSKLLADVEAAIRPGIREYELLAVLTDSLLRQRGEYLYLKHIGSGTTTNPWYPEAHDKVIMAGDLVGVDTDAHGYQGYVIDSSRTFLCGDVATAAQKEAYRVAYEAVQAMTELAKPGVTYEEFANAVPPLPEKYRAQRYDAMTHTVGLEDDDAPYIPYPDVAPAPDRVIREDMILNFECYAGEVGAPFGVKLEDQVLITGDGPKILVPYPFEAKLLD